MVMFFETNLFSYISISIKENIRNKLEVTGIIFQDVVKVSLVKNFHCLVSIVCSYVVAQNIKSIFNFNTIRILKKI
jgi:hypothetical protein